MIVLRFPRNYEPEEKFYVLQIYYSVWLQKASMQKGDWGQVGAEANLM